MYEEFFADRLSELRTEKNVSAREMSLALGQNASYINRIENRKAFPSMQLFFYICEYLGITPQDFFSTAEIRDPGTRKELPRSIYELTDMQLDLLSQFIKSFGKEQDTTGESPFTPPLSASPHMEPANTYKDL